MKYIMINFNTRNEMFEAIKKLIPLGYCFSKLEDRLKRYKNADSIEPVKKALEREYGEEFSLLLGKYLCKSEWEIYDGHFTGNNTSFIITTVDEFISKYMDAEPDRY